MSVEIDVGQLFQEHGDFIARAIERLTGEGAHVDDLLQECFVTAYKKRTKSVKKR